MDDEEGGQQHAAQAEGGESEEEEEGEEEGEGEEGREDEGESEREREREKDGKTSSSAGTILGIHNLAIVLPQFFVALIANLLFRLSPSNSSGIVWVLRFGGCMGLLAALATRWVPLTRTEREVKRLERRRRRRRGKGKGKGKGKNGRRVSGGR
ncbi:hypothetical protein A4X03_0g9734 [Tilletia caries]|uniref:Uncharacterized protein n=1 Tax=Tilletia caries TaxID=13290 RepID=A0A8T8S9I1_9BASI|nr:hypothetical protein A4X03_0g9734 [Tilletia caries]